MLEINPRIKRTHSNSKLICNRLKHFQNQNSQNRKLTLNHIKINNNNKKSDKKIREIPKSGDCPKNTFQRAQTLREIEVGWLGTWVAGNEELETWYLYCAVINIKETTKCASENFKLKPLRQRERSGGGGVCEEREISRENTKGKGQKGVGPSLFASELPNQSFESSE